MKGVWISRPRRRAPPLARALQQNGLSPFIKPAMRIGELTNRRPLAIFIDSPQAFHLAIFVSEEAARRLRQNITSPPPNITPIPALAIGPATRAAIRGMSMFCVADEPAGDSRALLKLPRLQTAVIRAQKIAVFGGRSARPNSLSPQLCRSLRQRGATVAAIAVYHRHPPSPDNSMAKLAAAGMLHAAVAYSGDTAAHMLTMTAPDNDWLKQLPLFVIHPHIVTIAKRLGYQNPQLAPADSGELAAYIARHLAA